MHQRLLIFSLVSCLFIPFVHGEAKNKKRPACRTINQEAHKIIDSLLSMKLEHDKKNRREMFIDLIAETLRNKGDNAKEALGLLLEFSWSPDKSEADIHQALEARLVVKFLEHILGVTELRGKMFLNIPFYVNISNENIKREELIKFLTEILHFLGEQSVENMSHRIVDVRFGHENITREKFINFLIENINSSEESIRDILNITFNFQLSSDTYMSREDFIEFAVMVLACAQ